MPARVLAVDQYDEYFNTVSLGTEVSDSFMCRFPLQYDTSAAAAPRSIRRRRAIDPRLRGGGRARAAITLAS